MSAEAPKVLFLSTVNPAARDVGKKVVVYGLCQYLHEKLGDNFLLATTDDVQPLCPWRIASLPLPGGIEKILNVVFRSFTFRCQSFQESIFLSDNLRKEITALVRVFRPSIVVFDTVRLGQYMRKTGSSCRSVLYYDDLFSLRYERMLQAATESSAVRLANPLGNFTRHLPHTLVKLIGRSNALLRWLLSFERDLVYRSEIRQATIANVCLLLNRAEVNALRARVPQAVVRECPPLLANEAVMPRAWDGSADFLFLGALNLPHNLTAVEHFLNSTFPKVLQKHPSAKLRIVGRGAPDSLQQLVSRFGECVILEGFVPDMRELMAKSCALVAPILFGSGIKIKIIEALAAGLPVVATPVGAEGVNIVNGQHGFIVQSLEEFPERMEEMLVRATNHRLSMASRRFYEAEYSKESVYRRYAEVFELDGLAEAETLHA